MQAYDSDAPSRHPLPASPPTVDPFALTLPLRHPIPRPMARPIIDAFGKFVGLPGLRDLYHDASTASRDKPETFLGATLAALEVKLQGEESLLGRLPSTGPVVVVANHPFGALEGVALGHAVGRRRPDVKLLANHLLDRIPEMRPWLLPVNILSGRKATQRNGLALRLALRWLHDGHVLIVFPAGEVAHPHLRPDAGIVDPPWKPAAAALAIATQAPVVPIYVHGTNSPWFQAAGLLHPSLRTLLLPRELTRQRGRTITFEVGEPVSPERLASFADANLATQHLRLRVYLFHQRAKAQKRLLRHAKAAARLLAKGKAVLPPPPAISLAAELAALPDRQMLAANGDLLVAYAEAPQIPHLLFEIGRLRELTFRQVGEGTGKSIDLDNFDRHYLHLFVWNRARQEVVGAYRLGCLDRIIPQHGTEGIYSASLFKFDLQLRQRLQTALELGRSFVRVEYQRNYSPLLLLWRGIGEFIAQSPQYRLLIGPVSISNAYSGMSRHLLVAFLRQHHLLNESQGQAKPRHPWRVPPWHGASHPRRHAPFLADLNEVGGMIADLEPDGKGVPVLLKQYLKLGGRMLAFNVDPAFNRAIDALVMVDLLETAPKVLEKYLGKPGMATFLDWHAKTENHPKPSTTPTRNLGSTRNTILTGRSPATNNTTLC